MSLLQSLSDPLQPFVSISRRIIKDPVLFLHSSFLALCGFLTCVLWVPFARFLLPQNSANPPEKPLATRIPSQPGESCVGLDPIVPFRPPFSRARLRDNSCARQGRKGRTKMYLYVKWNRFGPRFARRRFRH